MIAQGKGGKIIGACSIAGYRPVSSRMMGMGQLTSSEVGKRTGIFSEQVDGQRINSGSRARLG